MAETHLRVERDPDGVGRIVLDRPEAKNALTIAMRDGIIDAIREFRADPAVRAVLITGEGDSFCAGMDLERVDRHPGRPARLRAAHHLRGAARGRADLHPRAVGARQADDRRGQRRRGRARRAPRARVRLRVRAPAHTLHLDVRQMGPRRRRRRRVPAPPPRRPAAREGDGDARRRRDRSRSRRPGARVPMRRRARRPAARRARAHPPARRRARPVPWACRSAC